MRFMPPLWEILDLSLNFSLYIGLNHFFGTGVGVVIKPMLVINVMVDVGEPPSHQPPTPKVPLLPPQHTEFRKCPPMLKSWIHFGNDPVKNLHNRVIDQLPNK